MHLVIGNLLAPVSEFVIYLSSAYLFDSKDPFNMYSSSKIFGMIILVSFLLAVYSSGTEGQISVSVVTPCNKVCPRGPAHVRECCRAHGHTSGRCSSGRAECSSY